MPPADSSALIVARFLKANHFDESYQAFISEAGLPQSAGDASKGDLTLETLLEEKKTFDLSVKFEKLGTGDETEGWKSPAPVTASQVTTLPSSSNLLSAAVEKFVQSDSGSKAFLLVTSADRRLHILDVPSCELQDSLSTLQDSPMLSCAVVNGQVLLTTSMSGQLVASDLNGNILEKRRDHLKYLVKVAVFHPQDPEQDILIATAGWDNKITLYTPTCTSSTNFHFNNPTTAIPLPSKPESLLFTTHPATSEPIILLARSDSNNLFYYTPTGHLLGKQNLAPHSNAWVAFTPSSLALCPTDPTLLAVGTNSVPHMKLLIVRLLIPPSGFSVNGPRSTTTARTSLLDDTPIAHETQASQARAALAVADREAVAILIHANTMAPQTPYSTPTVAWRPDGSGVWVNGDDGVIRGLEVSTGKVVSKLGGASGGHEEGSKVRCLWAGMVAGGDAGEGEEEWLVSGGFDQRLIVWKAAAVEASVI